MSPGFGTAHVPDSSALVPGMPRIPGKGSEIQLENVRHGFLQHGNVVRALWDFSLHIPSGQFVSVIGPSGCGKTTMLLAIGGLLHPKAGRVTMDGKLITAPPVETAYMPARDALMPWRSALANIEIGLQVKGVPKDVRRETSLEWLKKVGLVGFENASPTQMSQGMRQRVAIARTLAQNPRCILMDEPFAALDAQTRHIQQREFLQLWETEGATVILVTHDLVEAIQLSDRVVLMSNRPGRVLEDVTIDIPRPRIPDEVQSNPKFLEYFSLLSGRLQNEVSESNFGAGSQYRQKSADRSGT